MTFAFHHYGGLVLGILIARISGLDACFLGVIGFIIGGFPDTASMIMYKLSQFKWWRWKKWTRWELHSKCHPPYDKASGNGKYDRIFKWIPFWGQHTWLIDSIIHPYAPRFIFPKFPVKWMNTVWINTFSKREVNWTKWDVLWVTLEVSLWILYSVIWKLSLIYL